MSENQQNQAESQVATITTETGDVILDVNKQTIVDQRTKFEQLVKTKLKAESSIKTKAEYDRIIQLIIEGNRIEAKLRTSEQQYHLRHHTTFTIANITRVLRKGDQKESETPKYYVYLEELFDVIQKEHVAVGHGKF